LSADHLHTPDAIAERLEAGPTPSYLRDGIYGAIDGSVTTFAVVSGVVGADLSPGVIIILGLANLAADGFSMAASNYASTRTEVYERQHFEAMEHEHIERTPEGEEEEVRQIYRLKGFEGEELETIVAGIVADRERWVETMLTEEHGLPPQLRSPWRAATTTLVAFVLCGSLPLAPYLLRLEGAFPVATTLTAATFFAVGSARSRWSVLPWWRLGAETLVIGALAASLAWLVGWALAGLAP